MPWLRRCGGRDRQEPSRLRRIGSQSRTPARRRRNSRRRSPTLPSNCSPFSFSEFSSSSPKILSEKLFLFPEYWLEEQQRIKEHCALLWQNCYAAARRERRLFPTSLPVSNLGNGLRVDPNPILYSRNSLNCDQARLSGSVKS